jgi:hypothetical protein
MTELIGKKLSVREIVFLAEPMQKRSRQVELC